MSKSILILKGSPRERGNSSILADQIAAGARAAGAEVESVWLHGLEIQPCSACNGCGGPGGRCVVQDDMQALYPKLAAAGAIVLASPVYWFTMSAQLKTCIDRWFGFQGTGWQELKGKQFAIVLTYGDTDLNSSGGINAVHTFESMCRFLRGEIVGTVHGSLMSAGEAEKKPALMREAQKLGEKLAGA